MANDRISLASFLGIFLTLFWAFGTLPQSTAADRDVQIRSVDFATDVLQLFNFGDDPVDLSGWRFCSHDDNQFRNYSSILGLNGVSIGGGESLFIHFNNDAAGPDDLNLSDLGGFFALPLDRGPFAIAIFVNSGFLNGANIADHLQWNIGGVDNITADERSDEAEAGGVWTDQSQWIATESETVRITLNDATGGILHGPVDYTVVSVGDMDGDGDVDFDDIDDFVLGLTDRDAYQDLVGFPPESTGDTDGDSDIDFDDIGGFVGLLTGGVEQVPEPASVLLLVSGLLGLVALRRSGATG